MSTVKLESIILTVLLVLCLARAKAQRDKPSLMLMIYHQAEKVKIDGCEWLYYEINISNSSTDSIRLRTIRVYRKNSHLLLFAASNEELVRRLGRSAGKNGYIKSNQTVTLYLEYPINSKEASDLSNELVFDSVLGHKILKKTDVIATVTRSPIALGPPLQGGPWAAVYDPGWPKGHRRVEFTVDGAKRIPGRFAIDFIKLNYNGLYALRNTDSVYNWLGYNADVLAVGDGVIASMKTDFPESATLSKHPAYESEQATGNYIAIKLSNHIYAFYEHLKPGSIKVKVGDWVKAGDVIASLGFTGQSTGPHLHFHIADNDSPLGAEGLPFVFKYFDLLGRYQDFSHFGQKPWITSASLSKKTVKYERPPSNAVIIF